MKTFRRGGSSPRGKPNTKVSAPLPVNLPSRRQEKAGIDSLVSSGSSWGSPLTPSSAVLATTSPAATSPATDGYNSSLGSGTSQLDSPPFQKTTPRAWGVVVHTPEHSLEEYPTAAEAAKKSTDLHEHQNHGIINNNTNANINTNTASTGPGTSTNPIKRANTPSNTTSGEPMAKTVSALSSGADNWDEADEDESVDFLNAEAIEFADGAVLVAAAVAQTAETQKEDDLSHSAPSSVATSNREERIVDRGDVDFNRAWPNRSQPGPGPGSSLYHPNPDQSTRYGSQDRSHPSLWQGGSNDRRLSADRTLNHNPNQRRESFGSRESYQGGPRRDSLGPKESFPGPRRDSTNYRDPQERRDSFNRSGSFNRDRDPYHHRENDFNMDRRPSHDRPPYTSDRFPDRHQRDFQLLTRPKEDPNDRLGPHDPNPLGQGITYPPVHHPPPGPPAPRGPHEPIHPRDMDSRTTYSHAHVPPATVEYDRPGHVTEDQREAMKHIADEARKRREEEEKKFEEGRARARAKADELALKAKEAQLAKAKEEEAAKEAEHLEKKKKEEEAAKSLEKVNAGGAPTLAKTDIPETKREFGNPRDRPHIKNMSESDRKEAMAQWQALPARLAKEEAERVAKIREDRRLKAEQEQASGAASSMPVNNATLAVGPWRRTGVESKTTSDAVGKPDISDKRDDNKRRESTKSGTSNSHPASQEVRAEQLDEVMHRIEESLNARGTSVKAMESAKQKSMSSEGSTVQGEVAAHSTKTAKVSPSENTQNDAQRPSASSSESSTVKQKLRNVKGASTGKDQGESLSNFGSKPLLADEKAPVVTPEAKKEEIAKDLVTNEVPSDGTIAEGRISRSAAAAIGKGSYPAKLNNLNGAVKISQISKIHARLSLQTAGDIDLELPNEQESQPNKANDASQSKETVSQKSHSTKRNSLLSSGTAIIFPVNVEKAAKNRGSVSFMVESEIEGPSNSGGSEGNTQSATTSSNQEESAHHLQQTGKEVPADDSIKKVWDSTQSSGHQADSNFLPKEEAHQVHQHDGVVNNVSQGIVMAPGMYVNPMTPMWSGPMGVESSQAGPGIAPGGVVMTGPGGGAGGHPGQPFQMMMPYYHQGFPVNGHMYYVYPQRGHMPPPPLAQFPGGVMAPHSSMPISPREGVNGGNLGSPDLTSKQVVAPHSSSGPDSKTDNVVEPNGGSHPWLPRFSAAGDAPPQQAVAGGSYIMPPHAGPPHANIIAAANINRAPHPRPFGHHQQQHQQQHHQHHTQHQQQQARMHNNSLALDGSIQEGTRSPPTSDGWGSDTTMTSGSVHPNNQSNSGGSNGNRNHNQGNAGSSLPWGSGSGRMNGNGPQGSYGNYQQQSPSSSSSGHPHQGGSYRGGRGGYNGGFGNHREFRPRGGYGGNHMGPFHGQHGQGQGHSPNFHYGQQGNMTGPHHQQHGSSSSGGSSSISSTVDHQVHNSTSSSFGGGSFSQRPAHVTATTTASVGSSGSAL
ncbi:hypothetical protein BGZ49_009471 [Haplosporangium sp. Z 27]|nr:hypothetical protein BGZ49_009471 [Haplosporangium sp. Z 27]